MCWPCCAATTLMHLPLRSQDPMRQVAKEAHATFAVLLDILELQSAREGAAVGECFLEGVPDELHFYSCT